MLSKNHIYTIDGKYQNCIKEKAYESNSKNMHIKRKYMQIKIILHRADTRGSDEI